MKKCRGGEGNREEEDGKREEKDSIGKKWLHKATIKSYLFCMSCSDVP